MSGEFSIVVIPVADFLKANFFTLPFIIFIRSFTRIVNAEKEARLFQTVYRCSNAVANGSFINKGRPEDPLATSRPATTPRATGAIDESRM